MKTKIIVNYLIGFIISVLISITALSLIAKLTVFNKDYIINLLEKENYFEKIYNEILEEMESDIMPSGFTNDIIKDTFTKDEVKEDIKTFINNVYQGNKTTLDKELLKDKIKCLYSYADGLINTFYKIYHIINKVVIVLLIVLFVLIFLAKLLFKYNYLSSSILASGLIILFIRIFIYERIDADYLLVITENFSNILTLIINTIGNYLLSIGIGLVIFGVISTCQVFLKKCQNKR